MDDKEEKDVEIKAKEVGPSSIKCPMLNNTNYTVWSICMKVALKVHKVWETIDPGTKDNDKNNMAIALLFQSIPKALILQEPKLVKKFLKSLPRNRYIHIVASLEQVLDLNTTSFEDIVGRLKAYEERISGEEEEDQVEYDDQGKFMYCNTYSRQYPQYNYGGNRGRGRGGCFQWRGRGCGRYGNYQRRDKELEKSITYYRCDKKSHYASNCPDRLLKLQEAVEKKDDDTQEADGLMMHEVVYLNEKKVQPSKFEGELDTKNVWYLDNGASNHMCGNREFFLDLDETVTGKVRFGDDSRIDIKVKKFLFDSCSKTVKIRS
ncbi:uncharacterized protein [Spinacia oleracea]|uniref:DUF4219 domain-containing protein n=1 Tax=Spinacia oleracea TaxID=3562 RepID=A0ABM3RJA4_SPIOL|nr:uncharacterized protein LOC130470118 [Spinacia oleracea]